MRPIGGALAEVKPAGDNAGLGTQRKTVTLVFSDVSGSTAMGERLDPESVREIMNRYFELARIGIERHGGTVEKYIGDAVMAAFGIPTAREDDALRAVRAAAEIREALHELNEELVARFGTGLRVRIGVNTGEVIAGDVASGQAFASGDAVNVAARLEQAAPPGEVLIGERTHRLVRDAIEAEATEPLQAKGKAEPLTAFRLLTVRAQEMRGVSRRLDAPIVGREEELGRLEGALVRVAEQERSELVVVIAEAGLGKSRLGRAFIERTTGATVIEARCPSYGEGALIPIQQALLRLAEIGAGDPPEIGREKLQMLAPDVDRLVLETLAAFLGLSGQPADIGEAAWAVTQLCDALANEKQLVLLLDDAHWADEALLGLAAELSAGRESPLLTVVLTRPDLLEEAVPVALLSSAETIRLRPLKPAAEGQIAHEVLGAEPPAHLLGLLRDRAAGNPLFLEELLRALVEGGLLVRENGTVRTTSELSKLPLPDTVEALLTARVESLAAPERAALEAASIAEDSIWVGALTRLLPQRSEPDAIAEIEMLIERGFLVETSSALADQRQFRFSHVLMREASYGLITKRRRAQLHERMADWLESRGVDGESNFDAAIGRHLASSHGYRAELGEPLMELVELASRAGRHLARGGHAALDREDDRLAVELLERAIGLAGGDAERAPVFVDLAEARYRLGEFAAAGEAGKAGIEAAVASDDCEYEWISRLLHATALALVDPEHHQAHHLAEARAAVVALTNTGHDRALTAAWSTLAHSLLFEGEGAAAQEASGEAFRHAQQCSERRWDVIARESQIFTHIEGPANVIHLGRICEDCLRGSASLGRSVRLEGFALIGLGFSLGAQGRVSDARGLFGRGVEILDQLSPMDVGVTRCLWATVELWSGDTDAAEQVLRCAWQLLEDVAEAPTIGVTSALLADVLSRQGRFEEAESWVDRAKASTNFSQAEARARWCSAAARARAVREAGEAAALAAEATDLADGTDLTALRADAWLTKAEVALVQGRHKQAKEAAHAAELLFREKGVSLAAAAAAELAHRASGSAAVN